MSFLQMMSGSLLLLFGNFASTSYDTSLSAPLSSLIGFM